MPNNDIFIMYQSQFHKHWAEKSGNSITFRRTEVTPKGRFMKVLGGELAVADIPKFIEWLQSQRNVGDG